MASSSFLGSEDQSQSQLYDSDAIQSSNSSSFFPQRIEKENNPSFMLPLPVNSNIYVIKNGLFTWSLLPIKDNKPRQMVLTCTECNEKKNVKVAGFQGSNFARHYKQKHPEIAFSEKSEGTRKRKNSLPYPISRQEFFNPALREKRQKPAFSQQACLEKVLHFIIENNLSFRVIDSKSFQQLLYYYNSESPTINRWNFRSFLDEAFNISLQRLNSELEANIQSLGTFSLTFDIWSSNRQNSYLGIILSYISSDFKSEYKVIGFNELNEAHTGLYIYNQFLLALKDFPAIQIRNIFSITRDNAANNNRFLTTFKAISERSYKKVFNNDIRCISHILNIVTQDILKEYLNTDFSSLSSNMDNLSMEEGELDESEFLPRGYNTLISRLRRIITIIKYNSNVRKTFLEGIRREKVKKNLASDFNIQTIPLDNATRWNSTYNMINIALILKEPINYINKVDSNRELEAIAFDDLDWAALYDLEAIFKVFLKASTKLQAQFYFSIPKGLLYIYEIYNNLESLKKDFENKATMPNKEYCIGYVNAISKGLEKLGKYFPSKLSFPISPTYKAYIIGIILDPRFKLAHFRPGGRLYHYVDIESDIKSIFKVEYERVKAKKGYLEPNQSFDELNPDFVYQSPSFTGLLEEDSDDGLYADDIDEIEEYEIYLTENRVKKTEDVIQWWKVNSTRFPILSILARRYIAIPATSAAIERVFSISSNIITKNRNRISSRVARQLILLKSWEIWDLDSLIEEINEEESEEEGLWQEPKGKERADLIEEEPIEIEDDLEEDSDFD